MNVNDAFPSKYIRASDLGDRRVPVAVDRVEIEEVGQEKDSRPVVYFAGKEKGMVLNKTNSKKLVEISGTAETDEWAGVKCVLYASETQFGGETVACVRIAPLPKTSPAKTVAKKPPVQSEPQPEREPGDDDVPF